MWAVLDGRASLTFKQIIDAAASPYGIWHMNEASGAILDSSGNGRDSTTHSSLTYSETGLDASTGTAVSANNALGSLRRSSLTATTAAAFTWIKLIKTPSSLNDSTQCIQTGVTTGLVGVNIAFSGTGSTALAIAIDIGGVTTTLTTAGGLIAASTEYTIAVTWDGTTLICYLNGVNVGSVTPAVGGSVTIHSTHLGIGRVQSQQLNVGLVYDTTALYTACWTPAQLTDLQAARV